MGCAGKASKIFLEIILIAVNVLLLIGGALVLYISMELSDSAWVEVMEGYLSSTDTIIMVINIIGWCIIGLALLGSLAACFRWRCGLLLYACIMLVAMVVFAVLAYFAFALVTVVDEWEGKRYPADEDEVKVRENFDKVYCYAQGAYVCNSMSPEDAVKMFVPDATNLMQYTGEFKDKKGVNALCDAYLNEVAELKPVCDGCEIAREFENLTSILDWADEQCPREKSLLLWCGNFLATSSLTSEFGVNPYTKCRADVLDLVHTSVRQIGIGSVIISGGALLVLLVSCLLRRRDRNKQDQDDPEQYVGINDTDTSQFGHTTYSDRKA